MEIHNEFIAIKYDLVFYSGKPVINSVHEFVDINGNPWSFSAATGFFLTIWQERSGGLQMIRWTSINLTSSVNNVILNAPAVDTNIEPGKYYYEFEYQIAGGYSILMMYGQAKFI